MGVEGDTRRRGIVGFLLTPVGSLIGALSLMSTIAADGWLYGWVQALTVGWRDALAWLEPYVQQIPYAQLRAGDMEQLTIIIVIQLAILRSLILRENANGINPIDGTHYDNNNIRYNFILYSFAVLPTIMGIFVLFFDSGVESANNDIARFFVPYFFSIMAVIFGLSFSQRQVVYIALWIFILHLISFLQRTVGTINPPWMPG